MKLLKKFSLASPLVIAICTTSSLFASLSMSDYSQLEEKYPSYFKGFSKTANDLELIEFYRGKEEFRDYDERLSSKFTDLHEELVKNSAPKLHLLIKNLQSYIDDNEKQNIRDYVYFLYTASLAISEHTDLEEQFFRLAGFSGPYSVIKSFDLNHPLKKMWRTLKQSYDQNDDRGDYIRRTGPYSYTDRTDNFSHQLNQSPFKDTPYFMLCTERDEDILGLYYLAWTYYKGIHPIPVTLDNGEEKLHGIKMSSWAKVCHDAAHHEIDLGDISVKQFSIILTNYYLSELTKKTQELDSTQRNNYSIPKMLPHLNAFAISIYEAYKESLLAILENSITPLLKKTDESALLPDLTAFIAGAFIHAHEERIDISGNLGTNNFQEIISKSLQRFSSTIENNPAENPIRDESALTDTNEEAQKIAPISGSFSTSYITGESSLTDEQIFDIVKKKKISEYLHTPYYYSFYPQNNSIEEDKIADYTVTRNLFYIQIKIIMIDGKEFIYREESNYSKRLNLDHDRHLLLPATTILKERYNYLIPPIIPTEEHYPNDPKAFEDAVEQCLLDLEKGRAYLMKFFLDQAIIFSTASSGTETRTIAEKYAEQYAEALKKLQSELPAFIGDAQQFVLNAANPPLPAMAEEPINAVPPAENTGIEIQTEEGSADDQKDQGSPQ